MLKYAAEKLIIESTGTSDRRQVNFDFSLSNEQASRLVAQGYVALLWPASRFDGEPTALRPNYGYSARHLSFMLGVIFMPRTLLLVL